MQVNFLLRIGQVVLLGLLLGGLGYLSDSPRIHLVDNQHTELRLVIRFSGKRIGECIQLTDQALADKAPNMRQATVCPRGKSSMDLTLSVNAEEILSETIHPSGLHNDGMLAMYRTFTIPVGMTQVDLAISERSGEPSSHLLSENIATSSRSNVILQFDDQGITLSQPGNI